MRAAQPDSSIRPLSLLSLSCQRQRLDGNLHLSKVGVLGNVDQRISIKVATIEIHPGIVAGWIFAQNAVEYGQWLEYLFPARMARISKAAQTDCSAVRPHWVRNELRAAGSDLLQ